MVIVQVVLLSFMILEFLAAALGAVSGSQTASYVPTDLAALVGTFGLLILVTIVNGIVKSLNRKDSTH